MERHQRSIQPSHRSLPACLSDLRWGEPAVGTAVGTAAGSSAAASAGYSRWLFARCGLSARASRWAAGDHLLQHQAHVRHARQPAGSRLRCQRYPRRQDAAGARLDAALLPRREPPDHVRRLPPSLPPRTTLAPVSARLVRAPAFVLSAAAGACALCPDALALAL